MRKSQTNIRFTQKIEMRKWRAKTNVFLFNFVMVLKCVCVYVRGDWGEKGCLRSQRVALNLCMAHTFDWTCLNSTKTHLGTCARVYTTAKTHTHNVEVNRMKWMQSSLMKEIKKIKTQWSSTHREGAQGSSPASEQRDESRRISHNHAESGC